MKLIVGLGNPGSKYTHTRHNIGFRVLDEICSDWTLMTRTSALMCKRDDVVYAKPQTFMNLSGAAVLTLLQFYKIEPTDMLVVYDCKDITFGTIRFRPNGSSGGHNGMNSIIASLGTQEFPRLRIGIAPVNETLASYETADYVLDNFTAEEEQALPDIISEAVEDVRKFIE